MGVVKNWRSAQIELLCVVPERPERHSQHFRGSRLNSSSPFKRKRDVMPVEFLAQSLQVEPLFELRHPHRLLPAWRVHPPDTFGRPSPDLGRETFGEQDRRLL